MRCDGVLVVCGAHLAVEENVFRLEVAVVHVVLVAMVQRRDNVHEVAPRLVFWQPTAFSNPVKELATLPDTRKPPSKPFRGSEGPHPYPASTHGRPKGLSPTAPPPPRPPSPPIPCLAQLHDHVDPFVMHVDLGRRGTSGERGFSSVTWLLH